MLRNHNLLFFLNYLIKYANYMQISEKQKNTLKISLMLLSATSELGGQVSW